MPRKYEICFADEIEPGGRRIVEIEGRSIGVFNVDGGFFAIRNLCPHKRAPLCRGILSGLAHAPEPGQIEIEREGEIIRCPWHGWEFDLRTGRSVFNPHRVGVRRFAVTVENDELAECPGPGADEDPSVDTYNVSIEQSSGSPRKRLFVIF